MPSPLAYRTSALPSPEVTLGPVATRMLPFLIVPIVVLTAMAVAALAFAASRYLDGYGVATSLRCERDRVGDHLRCALDVRRRNGDGWYAPRAERFFTATSSEITERRVSKQTCLAFGDELVDCAGDAAARAAALRSLGPGESRTFEDGAAATWVTLLCGGLGALFFLGIGPLTMVPPIVANRRRVLVRVLPDRLEVGGRSLRRGREERVLVVKRPREPGLVLHAESMESEPVEVARFGATADVASLEVSAQRLRQALAELPAS